MQSNKQNVLSRLRRMIVDGELTAGQRLAEIPTAERLGVSRTPVRIAFRALEQEGLLIRHGARGYAVRKVSDADLANAVEVRGVLEGLAARQAAEQGIDDSTQTVLLQCLRTGDALFEKGYVTEQDLAAYHDLNQRFHQAIITASGNSAVAAALSRHEHIPFASVSALAIDSNNLSEEFRRFQFAHMQHHTIVDALLSGQGARAEALMREHANATLRYARLFAGTDTGKSGVLIIG